MKLFMFSASLQEKSVNKKLINLAAKYIQEWGHQIDLAQFNEFNMPLYNADIQNNQGFPNTVTDFIERMHAADGVIISVPEYNFSIPGTFKNLIDWVSRVTPMPWRNQCIQLLSASPSLVGGNRSLWAARVPLECCGSYLPPNMFSLATAHESFDEKNNLKSPQAAELLTKILHEFLTVLQKFHSR